MQRFQLSTEEVMNVLFGALVEGSMPQEGGVQRLVRRVNDRNIKVRMEREKGTIIVADAFVIH